MPFARPVSFRYPPDCLCGHPIPQAGFKLYLVRMSTPATVLLSMLNRPVAIDDSVWLSVIANIKDYAIFLVDTEGKVASWNSGAALIKGYSDPEILGKPISIFYPDEDIQRGEPSYNLRMAETHGHHYSEGWRIRKDGSRFWAEIVFTAVFDANAHLVGYAKITRDMTEQMLARERIARQARLIEDITDAMIATDNNFMIKSWNAAAETLFGYSTAEALGASVLGVMRAQIDDDLRQPILQHLTDQSHWKGRIIYLDKHDAPITLLVSISVTHDAEGKSDGYVIVCRDVTEWKQTEARLREFNSMLEEQVRMKTEAMQQQNIELREPSSHLQNIREKERAAIAREIHDELGQQLTALKMDISWLCDEVASGKKGDLDFRMMSATRLLDQTIHSVRKIATELHPGILDDLGLFSALEWQTREFERRFGIKTKFTTSLEDFPEVPGRSIALYRICQEALTNIARHSHASNVLVTLDPIGDRLLLRISDNGQGMKTGGGKQKKRLGLLSIKERVLMLDGEILIESVPDKGVILSIIIPLQQEVTHNEVVHPAIVSSHTAAPQVKG